MPNTILTPTQVTREALRILHNKLNFIGAIDRQYDNSFAKTGAKIGEQLKVRLPNRYTIRTGSNMSAQYITEQSVTLAVATQKGVDLTFSSFELTMQLDDFSKRILEPAMAVLAANIEADAFSMYQDIYNLVGSPATVPNSLLVYLQAKQKLNEFLAPKDGNRSAIINSAAMAATVDALKGLFHSADQIDKQYREGLLGKTAGLSFYENDLVPVHTNGNKVAGVTVSGASQTGSSLNIGNVANLDTFKEGTVFTIAGVNAIHPETRQSYGFLQQFVVTADVTMSTTTGTIAISPPITVTGAYQTVTASPADGAAITIVGAASTGYAQNIAFHKSAFTFVSADLEMPQGVDFAAREVYDGISMRIIRDYTIASDQFPCRIDVLYGFKTLLPQLACRITA